MKITPSLFAIASVCAAYLCSTALAEPVKEHTVITSEEIKWGAGPAALPPGAELSCSMVIPLKRVCLHCG